ncbi:16S rRNA (uracil(1498)-N(3))-methyltransferase [candidate division WOR-3 bacterium]|nr:16S rRNA (uracil(1498)-N(3))-methyltransferase [candidate division WOR-3 bacterium]
MHYFFNPDIEKKDIFLPEDEMKHLRVRRIGKNETFGILDGRGSIYYCHYKNKQILLKKVEKVKPLDDFTVSSPFPEGKRVHFLIEKLAEFGLKKFIPLVTERTQLTKTNRDKMGKYLIAGMKQSGNPYMCEITEPMKLGDLLGLKWSSIYYGEKKGQKINRFKSGSLLIIGPEGGFTEEEKEEIQKAKAIAVSFSRFTLRMESAVISFLANISK